MTWETQAEESELGLFVLHLLPHSHLITCLPHSQTLSHIHNVLPQSLEKGVLILSILYLDEILL